MASSKDRSPAAAAESPPQKPEDDGDEKAELERFDPDEEAASNPVHMSTGT
jgi:hypothetical protein